MSDTPRVHRIYLPEWNVIRGAALFIVLTIGSCLVVFEIASRFVFALAGWQAGEISIYAGVLAAVLVGMLIAYLRGRADGAK